jgi:hypothetical protein
MWRFKGTVQFEFGRNPCDDKKNDSEYQKEYTIDKTPVLYKNDENQ